MLQLLGKTWCPQLAQQQASRCSSAVEAVLLTAVRWASAKHGRKRNFQNYEEILEHWRRSQPHRQHGGGSSSSSSSSRARHGRAGKPAPSTHWFGSEFHDTSSRWSASRTQRAHPNGRQRKKSAAVQFEWHSPWSDAARAQAAAAAQLDPEELHNLVFETDEDGSYSSRRPQSCRDRRRQRREQRRRTRRMQRAAKGGSGYAYAEYSYWSDGDSEDEDEFQFHWYKQQPQQHGTAAGGRPEWQWWTEEQERQWFENAWQQQDGQHSGQQQQQQQQQQKSSSSSSGRRSAGSSRPWWEQFQQAYQQQQRQHASGYQQTHQQQRQQAHQSYYQRQHQQQHWGSSWQQQQSARHPQSVLNHLAVLGLPPDAALQRSQLKVAFHRAAMQWHPDMHADEVRKAAAEAKFKQVKEAYESLVTQATA